MCEVEKLGWDDASETAMRRIAASDSLTSNVRGNAGVVCKLALGAPASSWRNRQAQCQRTGVSLDVQFRLLTSSRSNLSQICRDSSDIDSSKAISSSSRHDRSMARS